MFFFFTIPLLSVLSRHLIINEGVGTPHVFSISVFTDFIYWGDWRNHTIYKAHKYHNARRNSVVTALINNTNQRPMDLHVMHPLRQPNGQSHGSRFTVFFFSHLVLSFICHLKLFYISVSPAPGVQKGKKNLAREVNGSPGLIFLQILILTLLWL